MKGDLFCCLIPLNGLLVGLCCFSPLLPRWFKVVLSVGYVTILATLGLTVQLIVALLAVTVVALGGVLYSFVRRELNFRDHEPRDGGLSHRPLDTPETRDR
jgi:hypothetical protein